MQSVPKRPPHFSVGARPCCVSVACLTTGAASADTHPFPTSRRSALSPLHTARIRLATKSDSFEAKAHKWLHGDTTNEHQIDLDLASSAVLYQALSEFGEAHAYRRLFGGGQSRAPSLQFGGCFQYLHLISTDSLGSPGSGGSQLPRRCCLRGCGCVARSKRGGSAS